MTDTNQSGSPSSEPSFTRPPITLSDLPNVLQRAVEKMGWTQLMKVQASAIPYLLAGQDVMVQSHTGSGKTAAFVLPIMERIDASKKTCQALVLVPTRELAAQVAHEAERLGAESGINTVVVYGGVGYGDQIDGFRKGAHLVVGTPGRIIDHLIKGNLDLNNVKTLIFDEADRLMSMGFYPDMQQIRSYLPEQRHSFMFSATFPPSVQGLAKQFLRDPEILNLSHESVHVTDTEHIFYRVQSMAKDRALSRIIDMENPESAFIFCNTKSNVHYVATVLQRFGYDADQITSDLSQQARESVLTRVRQGRLRFLVATDLAARGIDVVHLSHVIQYDFPEDPESYIHRAGRTGRAGAGGIAISLVDVIEAMELKRTAKRYSIDMEEREVPSGEQVQTIVSERVIALLETKLRSRDRLHHERMQRLVPLARDLGESDDEIALIAMLLDDFYHDSLHGVPELPDDIKPKPAASPSAENKPRRSGKGGGRRRRR